MSPYKGQGQTYSEHVVLLLLLLCLVLGYRLPAPEGTPGKVYSVMEQCWQGSAKDRPKFEQIKTDLESVLRSL